MITRRVIIGREYPDPIEAALGMIDGTDAWDIARKSITAAKRHEAFRDLEPQEIKIYIYAPPPPQQQSIFGDNANDAI